jgi:photosystem II stability/assembly factor-like uncharacterized protein
VTASFAISFRIAIYEWISLMSNLSTSEHIPTQVPVPGIGARLLKLIMMLLPWIIIAALLGAGLFIHPQPVGGTVSASALERRDQFYGLAELPGGAVLASGSYGKILSISRDGQIRRLSTPTRNTLQDIAVWDAEHSVAVGNDGVILFSLDGGLHWNQATNVPRSGTANKLNRVRIGAEGLAIATGEMGAVLISRDFGRHWQRLRDEEDVAWNDVAILDNGQLVLVGEFGRVLLGNLETGQWREVESPLSSSLMALTFRDAQHGMAVGLEGGVMETRDGGQHWDVIDVGLRDHLFDVAWLQEQGVWFVTGALGRWASGDAKGWQSGTLDAQNLSWHVRALPVAGGIWLAGADIGRWDGKVWSLLKP